jgi:hypothetical protein
MNNDEVMECMNVVTESLKVVQYDKNFDVCFIKFVEMPIQGWKEGL